VEKITYAAGGQGIPVHVNVASRHRKIPRAGFAAVQDDISCGNRSGIGTQLTTA